MSEEKQIPIWFFIGALILVYGILITGSGVYGLFVPSEREVALQHFHPDLWWGLLLLAVGLYYAIRFNPFRR